MNFSSLFTPRVLATVCFSVGAAASALMWATVLFGATPRGLTAWQGAGQALLFFLAEENDARWWFVGWAMHPFALLALALAHGLPASPRWPWLRNRFVLSVAIGLMSLLLNSETAWFALIGAFCSFQTMRQGSAARRLPADH